MKALFSFFEDVEDSDFRVKMFTTLSGAWLLINFIAQLPVMNLFWISTDNLILARSYHGAALPMALDLLTHYPELSPVIYILTLVLSMMMVMGRTNLLSRIAIWYFVFLLDAKAWTILDGGNNLIHLTLFYSILFEGPEFVRKLGVRAIQVQFVLVYACAFFSKVGGELWQNGTALYYVVQVDKFHSAGLLSLFKAWPVTAALMAYGTVLIQLILATFLWKKNLRLPAIFLGVMVHTGIAVSMGLIAFSLVMIAHYSIFLTRDEVNLLRSFTKKITAIAFVLFSTTAGGATSDSFIMDNLKPDSKILVVQNDSARMITRKGIRTLTSSEWKSLELEYGSVTKLITALKIQNEVKKRRIDRRIVDHLLFHTSGIRDDGPDHFIQTEDKHFAYSNANYAIAGKFLKNVDTWKYSSDNKSELINFSRRPVIKPFYRPAFGIIGSAGQLASILKKNPGNVLPCHEDGKCWGGFKKGSHFYTIGKLASGTTLGRSDGKGNYLILSSNDYTIDLEKIVQLLGISEDHHSSL